MRVMRSSSIRTYKELSKIKKVYVDLNVLSSGVDKSDQFYEQSN
jgi:hypothetical protein